MSVVERISDVPRLPSWSRSRAPAGTAVHHAVSRYSVEVAPLAPVTSDNDVPQAGSRQRDRLEDFFEAVDEVKGLLTQIRQQLQHGDGNTHGLAELLQELSSSVDSRQVKSLGSQIDTCIASVTELTTQCQAKLKLIQRETTQLESKLPEDYNGSEVRIRKSITSGLAQQASQLIEVRSTHLGP